MIRIMLMFDLRLETEYLGYLHYPFHQRQILLLEGMKESWQEKVAISRS